MKICTLVLGILVLWNQILFSQHSIVIKIGSVNVFFDYIAGKSDSLIFVNLHNNEKTSITAIKQILLKSNGRYFGIQTGNKRELNVFLNAQSISFDPNRIFTKTGIEKTLKNYHCFSEINMDLVNTFAKELLVYLTKAKLLVAVHNSSDGDFSVKSFLKTNSSKKDAIEVNINPNQDEDDFYLVTQKSKYEYLKASGYNVVLQDNINVEDDGSLSVYCGKANINYVNIECQTGHLKEQIKMIQEIYKGLYNK